MVAAVVDVRGELVAVHRTFVKQDGTGKALVEPPKASLGPVAGAAVRLDPVGREIIIAEGIESAAAAGRLYGLPAWAAVSAGNLGANLELPPEVRSVTIAADRDPAGESAARAATLRWRCEGREVRVIRASLANADFADVLAARMRAGAP
jgi:hypothetical protein